MNPQKLLHLRQPNPFKDPVCYYAVYWMPRNGLFFMGNKHRHLEEVYEAIDAELKLEPHTKVLAVLEIIN